MTLIVAIKYKDGVSIGVDSRTTYGEAPLMREEPPKMEELGKNIVISGTGFSGAIDKVLHNINSSIKSMLEMSFKDIAEQCEKAIWAYYQKYKERLQESESEVDIPVWVLATHDRILRIFDTGVSEEEKYYCCEGSGRPYGEYILQHQFKPNMNEKEAARLVAYTILQTSRIDPNVGGRINIALIRNYEVKKLTDDEVNELSEELIETERPAERDMQEIAGEIVEKRRWINTAFNDKFGFELFKQNEFAISNIQKGCRNESDFTDRISTLSMLIDDVDVSSLNKSLSTAQEGSINVLEAFLKEKYQHFNPAIITNLREIKVLRSKKMPIHEDDPKILKVILKWECKIPPNWGHLWMLGLQKYKESITMLAEVFSS
jgi:20S proteasome alpha/beta subunit